MQLSIARHAKLLETLKRYDFLAGYSLEVYCRHAGKDAPGAAGWRLCKLNAGEALCNRRCRPAIDRACESTETSGGPALFRCPIGLIGFAVPMPFSTIPGHCLVGGGMRAKWLDLYRLETVARAEQINPFALLEQLRHLPVATEKGVEETAKRVQRLAASLLKDEPAPPADGRMAEKLHTIAAVAVAMDRATSGAEAVSLLSETAGILFDIPGIAVALEKGDGRGFALQGTWGFSVVPEVLSAEAVRGVFSTGFAGRSVLRRQQIDALLPGAEARSAICLPLAAEDRLQGMVVLLNRELPATDLSLVEMLTGRAAARVATLRREEEFARESSRTSRLLTMISTLSLTEDRQELHRLILEMGADIADATCGSLMLVSESGETLRIESAIGINPQLARIMSVRMGSGIAGKVAASGTPLLVNDIEIDERIASQNRPRFKTKSFISVPLMFKGEPLGVLNLSDKKDHGIFTKADLDILTPLVNHAAAMIQQAGSLEKIELLEKLSITDSLTELYNRRFLERRMEEELNRSERNGLPLTVMLIDLDNFKVYNDICGHVAGDRALKKAAQVLRESVREMDVVTRYGGEEFCVLLPGTTKRESIFVAERVRRGIESELFSGEEHLPQGRMTTSIGLSSFPEDGVTAATLINAADIALYRAKAEGRNRIMISNGTDEEKATHFPRQSGQGM